MFFSFNLEDKTENTEKTHGLPQFPALNHPPFFLKQELLLTKRM